MPFFVSNDDYGNFVGDQWQQQAQGKVADQWAASAVADAPDRAAAAEQAAAQQQAEQARQQAAAQAQAAAEAQRQADEQAKQQADAAAAAQAQQQQANTWAANTWADQAYSGAATAATGVAPTPAPAPAPEPAATQTAASVGPSTPLPSASSGNYVAYAWQAAQNAGLDPNVFVRQIQQESGFNPNAKSPAGAIGIAQFMPATARGAGIDPTNPLASLDAAAKMMAGFVQQFGGDMGKALAAYNAGPGAVQKYGGIPPYAETQDYVKIILGDAAGLGAQLAQRAKEGLGAAGQAVQDITHGTSGDHPLGPPPVDNGHGGTGQVFQTPTGDWNIAFGFNQPYGAAQFNQDIPNHRGVDLTIPGAQNNGRGTPYTAFQPGTVVALTHDPDGGNGIIVQTADGLYNRYFHNDKVLVGVGDKVDQTTQIGVLGASGTEGFPHLHFEVSRGINGDPTNQLIDPRPYMMGGGGSQGASGTAGQSVTTPAGQSGSRPSQPQPQTMAQFIQQYQSTQGRMPTDTELGNFILSQPPEQTAASVGTPQPIQQPSSPFDVIGNIASGLGTGVRDVLGNVSSGLQGIFGGGSGSPQPPGPQGPPVGSPAATASPFPGLPQLPTGMPPEGGGYGVSGTLLPGEAASAFAPVGQAITGLASSPLLPTNLTNAGLQAVGQNVVAPGLEALAQPGGPLIGPRTVAAQAIEGLAGQVPAGVPVVGGLLERAAGFIGAPTIIDAAQTATQLEQKYGGGLQTTPDGRVVWRPPDYSRITPEDQNALSNAMLAVGGVTLPPGPEAGKTAAETGGTVRPTLSTQESNFLQSHTLVPISDPRPPSASQPGLPNVKAVMQQNLAEVLPGDAVLYHETSLPNARAILQRVEAGPRNQSIWTADTRDLALGQGGKGVTLEFDPALVNGGAGENPAKAFSAQAGMGTEYQLDKTLRGAVQAIVVNSQRQADQLAADPLIASRFDFSAAQQTSEGIRIPYAGPSRAPVAESGAGMTPVVVPPTAVGQAPEAAPTILERFGLTDRPVEGAAPLSDDALLSHYQGLEQQYEANNAQIARLADQLHEARNPGVAPIRPQWAVGLPNESVIKIANDHGVSPYREDWWEQVGLSQGSQEVSRLLSEGGYRGVGTRRLGGSQLQNAQAELDRLRAENQAITDHLDPLTAAEPGTLYRAPAQPVELPFAPPTNALELASRESTTATGTPVISPPTPVGRSEAIAATTPANLGVRENTPRVGTEAPAAAPVNGTAGGNLPVEQIPEVQRVREAANPPPQVNPADNGIPPPPGEPPRPVSTNPDDFDANVRAAVEQEAKKPGSFWQVLNAYHSGNVVMGPFTLGKVAANTMFQPTWNLGTQTARDLLTLKIDRAFGRSVGAGQALWSIGNDFMDGFGQAMAGRTTSSIPMVDHFLQAQHAVGGALHAGMQNVAAEAVRRMELGAAAGEQVAAQGGRGIEGIGKIADLVRDSSSLPDEAVFRAADMADRAGLRSPAGATQQVVQSMLNQAANTPAGAVANFLLPVFRIGAQATARLVEASPVGLVGTGVDVARGAAGFGPYAEGFSQYGQAVTPLADRLTANLAGTAITAFLASKSLDGTITGTGPDDPHARANLEAQGWRPKSVLVPGVGYVSWERLPEQIKGPLMIAGAYGDAVREHPDDPQGVAGRLAQEVATMFAQGAPGLSTLADIGGILKGDPYAIGYLVGGSAAGYIPGSALLGNVATAMDPLARKIPTTEGIGQAILGNVQQSIPGLREQLQARTSVLGQPMPNPAAGLTGLLPWRTPGEIAPGTPGLQALKVFNANGVTLGAAPKTVTLGNGSRVDLTDDEQQQYEAHRAVLLDQMTSSLAGNQQFVAAPGAARKQVLDRLIRQADTVAGRQVVGAIAQGGDFASRLQGPKRLEEPTPAIRPPLALTELNSATAPVQATRGSALPLTSDLATLDPIQQEQLRRQLAGTP